MLDYFFLTEASNLPKVHWRKS